MLYLLSNNQNRRASLRVTSLICLSLLLTILSSCTVNEKTETGELLLQTADSASTDTKTNIIEVALGSVSRNSNGEGSVFYPQLQNITCSLNNARLVAVSFKRGDAVKKGDAIAVFTIDYNESELTTLRSNLSIAEKRYDFLKSSYKAAVTTAENTVSTLTYQYKSTPTAEFKTEIDKAKIALNKAQSAYKFFVYDQSRSLNTMRKSIRKIEATIANNTIYAPFDGKIDDVEYLVPGNLISTGTLICKIYSDETVWVSTTSDSSNSMRYNSPAKITVSVVKDVYQGRIISSPDLFANSTGQVTVIPDSKIDINPQDRMRRLSVSTPRFELEQVITLPSASVYNEDGKRFVYIYEDGILKKRYVTIGLSSPSTVQILDGLSVGQKVVLG